jgi:hypothetical protein
MNRTARLQPIVELALLLAGAVSTLPSCATYQDGQNMSASLAGASAGTGGDVPSAGAGGLEQAAGGGGSPATGGAEQSSTGGTVDGAAGALMAGGTSLGGGGASSAGAGGSPSDGGSSTGGASAAGAPGAGGTTGSAGQAGAMGSAGAPVVDQLISQGKTASANSEQTGNLAPAGNDGSMTSATIGRLTSLKATRWARFTSSGRNPLCINSRWRALKTAPCGPPCSMRRKPRTPAPIKRIRSLAGRLLVGFASP